MIVRILGEGQYELPSSQLDRLNRLDNRVVHAVAKGDRQAFGRLLGQMLTLVRTRGTGLPPDTLKPSDVVLPGGDLAFEEAKELFVGEGLIPG
ncbi:MAG: hypothetical protein HY686_02185 [Chloroflexi bacterium]|nr:hypothetical protein [Chloroflexota bacterium]